MAEKKNLMSGDYELSHMVHANCQVNEKIRGRLDEGEQEDKFVDEDFDIASDENAGSDYGRLEEGAKFIDDTDLDSTDVAQGGLGDCWFLSALSSLAQRLPDDCPLKVKQVAVERVIQRDFNTTEAASVNGMYRFKFFRLGEWVDVLIDDQLPTSRRASPSSTGEWWVPLVEKAYAKFCGSYNKINGGNTCWAMTDLTGGIAVEMKNLTIENAKKTKENMTGLGMDLFTIFQLIQHRAVVCTSNLDEGGNETIINGLVCGHAYSLLKIEEIDLVNGEKQRLVKIRNPWASTEWTGPWGDGTEEWEGVSDEEKERIEYENKDDGGFWMSFKDWIKEFEMFTICMLPRLDPDAQGDSHDEEESKKRDHRVIGTFIPGTNSPTCLHEMQEKFMQPERNVQVYLQVDKIISSSTKPRMIWLQFLLDCPIKEQRYLMFDVYQLDEKADAPIKKYNRRGLRNLDKINPKLPKQEGYVIDYYRHNGYMFALETDRKYVIVATTATPQESTQECKFMIRTIGPKLTLTHLENADETVENAEDPTENAEDPIENAEDPTENAEDPIENADDPIENE